MFSLLLYVVLEGAIKDIQGFEATLFVVVCLIVCLLFVWSGMIFHNNSSLLLYVFLEGAIKEFRGFKANMFVFVDTHSLLLLEPQLNDQPVLIS